MHTNRLFSVLIFTLVSLSLLVFSGPCLEGAKNGVNLCFAVVIPSLFPFTVCSLVITECGIFEKLNNLTNKRNIPLTETFIYIFSLIGGFPIGAKLINTNYIKGNISKNNAENMLAYCVNSGPAFIIIAIGCGILQNKKLGFLLFFANIVSTFLLFFIINFKKEKSKTVITTHKISNNSFSEIFVSSTYDATKSMGLICAFVILFSTIIELIKSNITNNLTRNLVTALLEITNGVTVVDNIFIIAFILGFSGICVHFQVLSMCHNIKPKYLKFLLFRTIHGILNSTFTYILIKLFKISITTSSRTNSFTFSFSQHSIVFGTVLIVLSVAFIFSVNSKNNIL